MIRYLLIFGFIQGFVFSVALLSIRTPKNRLTNRFFALLIFVVSIFLLISSQMHHFGEFPKFFLTSYVLVYLYCPLYYLFTESVVAEDFKFKRVHLLLLLPAVLYLLASVRFLVMESAALRSALQSRDYLDLLAMDFTSIGVNVYFVWRSWRLIRRANQLSIPHAREWPFAMLSIILLITNLGWLYVVVPQFGIFNFAPIYSFEAVYLTMSFAIFFFGYILIIRAEYFSVRTVVQQIRYRNVNMDKTLIETVEQKIVNALESTKPYKQASFSLQDLANLTGVDKFKISYTINKSMNTNFTSLVNKYRVGEFIELVNSKGYSNFSILGIAMEAGFSSKSTFYKAFKEIHGQTPKEFFKDVPDSDLKSA